jgi:Ser/Thr protein kinase RdoA (MazF antagonist)
MWKNTLIWASCNLSEDIDLIGMDYSREALESVLSQYELSSAKLEPLSTGLINHSFRVTDPSGKFFLQRVNKIFAPESHSDIDRVTQHLQKMGMVTPRLVHSTHDDLYYEDHNGLWRLFTYIEGVSIDIVKKPEEAFQAGALLGRFHLALGKLDYEFVNPREAIHQLDRHIQHLQLTLKKHHDHTSYKQLEPLAMEILEQATSLPELPEMSPHKVHGDPKINNILFYPDSEQAICMVDFDTLSNMPIALELGDAMRSWCNPDGENIKTGRFSMEIFEAGIRGYISTAKEFVSKIELAAVLPATRIIYIELAARFCADALNEDYFAWNPVHFASHTEHSQIRSTCQLNCYKSLSENLSEAEQILSGVIE